MRAATGCACNMTTTPHVRRRSSSVAVDTRMTPAFSVTLPLWDPSPVEVGAVGFLSKPCGTFVTLFNSFDPPKSSGGRTKGMASLYGYGRPKRGSQRQDKRTAAQRSLDVIYGLMTFKSRGEGLFS